MDYSSAEVLGHVAAGIAGGVAGNTELMSNGMKMSSGKQAVKPTIDSVPDKVRPFFSPNILVTLS